MSFYVYAIVFDQEVFGIYATREEAGTSLKRQIEAGGPAWEDCEVVSWLVGGDPETAQSE